MTKDELIEELETLLRGALNMAEGIEQAAERRRAAEVKAVTLNLLSERYREQQEMDTRLRSLGGGIASLQQSIAQLPKPQRQPLVDQINELSALVKQSLDGGPVRPLALSEIESWQRLRKGHASDKKIQSDGNRVKDFVAFAGNRPVNKYRYSDFQAFANLLARLPANYVKEPRLRGMTREEAADYNDSLPPDRRYRTLVGGVIDTNYISPLRIFFRAMAAEHDFHSPLADIAITIPTTATESTERAPFSVADLNTWFIAAAKETRPDLKWLPLLGTLTGARVIEIALTLLDAGERFTRWKERLPHGAYLPWVATTGYSEQKARNVRNVFKRFRDHVDLFTELDLALPETAIPGGVANELQGLSELLLRVCSEGRSCIPRRLRQGRRRVRLLVSQSVQHRSAPPAEIGLRQRPNSRRCQR